ncbi:hypothetical protein [Mangrovicoccus ximenensis]|uniref:hypothetical protein n=1 Tax=Mangrovicoccus ximenensis TaxID=1911570 RepID=UPI0011AEB3F0|nr:hypothetical protein [Mangrovicoccus ximenensis]
MLASLRRMAGSVGVKVGGIIVLLAALTIFAVATSLSVFGDFSRNLDRFETREVPALRQSSKMTEAVSEIAKNLSSLLIAGTAQDIDQLTAGLQDQLLQLDGFAEGLPEAQRAEFSAQDDRITRAIADISKTRRDELRDDEATLERSDGLVEKVAVAQGELQRIWGEQLAIARGTVPGTSALARSIALEKMSEAVQLERRATTLLSVILTGASADDPAGVDDAQRNAETMAANIRATAATFSDDERLSEALDAILAETDPAAGLLSLRRNVVLARAAADEASGTAADSKVSRTGGARVRTASSRRRRMTPRAIPGTTPRTCFSPMSGTAAPKRSRRWG